MFSITGPFLVFFLLKSPFFPHWKVFDLKSSKQDFIFASTVFVILVVVMGEVAELFDFLRILTELVIVSKKHGTHLWRSENWNPRYSRQVSTQHLEITFGLRWHFDSEIQNHVTETWKTKLLFTFYTTFTRKNIRSVHKVHYGVKSSCWSW